MPLSGPNPQRRALLVTESQIADWARFVKGTVFLSHREGIGRGRRTATTRDRLRCLLRGRYRAQAIVLKKPEAPPPAPTPQKSEIPAIAFEQDPGNRIVVP